MYNKNSKLDKEHNKLTVDDLFNLILIKKRLEGSYTSFNYKSLKILFEAYGKYEKFLNVYKYIELDEEKGFDFTDSIKKNIKANNVILSDDYVMVSLPEYKLKRMEKEYSEDVYLVFNGLIFAISNDLKYGYGKWYSGFEDKYEDVYSEIKEEIAPQKVKKTK